jgi:hypothetical protein
MAPMKRKTAGGTMRRFSIRTVMGLVVLIAVGLAALKNGNEVWDGIMLLTALAAVGVAILAATFSRERERAWCVGFALFGGCYLHLAVGPWTNDGFRQRLITTSLIGDLRNWMFESSVKYLLIEKEEIRDQLAKLLPTNGKYDPVVASLQNNLRAIDNQLIKNKTASRRFDYFQSIGHSLFALLAGLLGGSFAVCFYARRQRVDTDAELLPRQSPPRTQAARDGDEQG